MKHVCFGIVLISLLGLAGCETSTNAHSAYRSSVVCTDLKPFAPPGKPPDEQPQPSCVAGNPGSEMFDRERGFISPIEGGAIIVTEVYEGLTDFR